MYVAYWECPPGSLGTPWLLIEICALVAGYGCVSGVSTGSISPVNRTLDGRETRVMPAEKAWVGVDVGKTHHWVCVLDADGRKVLSIKIANDQAELTAVIARVSDSCKTDRLGH